MNLARTGTVFAVGAILGMALGVGLYHVVVVVVLGYGQGVSADLRLQRTAAVAAFCGRHTCNCRDTTLTWTEPLNARVEACGEAAFLRARFDSTAQTWIASEVP